MTLVRRLARPLLASVFITSGIEALTRPGDRMEKAEQFGEKVAEPLGLPNDPELLVRINGAVMIGAGAMLGSGRMPRVASTALAASLAPTVVLGHPFWEESDPEVKRAEKKQFFKNLGLLGGVLLASVDTAGQPGLRWRSKNAAKVAGLESKLAAKSVTDKLP